jgi:hypothetical protein
MWLILKDFMKSITYKPVFFLIAPLLLGATSASGMNYLPSFSSVRNTLTSLATPHHLERLSNIAAVGTIASAGAAYAGFSGCTYLSLACGAGSFMSHQLASYLRKNNISAVTPQRNQPSTQPSSAHTREHSSPIPIPQESISQVPSSRGYVRLEKIVKHILPTLKQPSPQMVPKSLPDISPDDMALLTWYENYVNGTADLSLIPDHNTYKFFNKIENIINLLQEKSPALYQKFQNLSNQHVKKICNQVEQDYQVLTPHEVSERYYPYSSSYNSIATCLSLNQAEIFYKFLKEKEKQILQYKIAEIEQDLQKNMSINAVAQKYKTQLFGELLDYLPNSTWVALNKYIEQLPAKETARRQEKIIAWLNEYAAGTAQTKDCPVSAEQLRKILPDILKNNASSVNASQIMQCVLKDSYVISDAFIEKITISMEPVNRVTDDDVFFTLCDYFLTGEPKKQLIEQHRQKMINCLTQKHHALLDWCKAYADNKSTYDLCPLAPQQLEKEFELLFHYDLFKALPEKDLIKKLQEKIVHDIERDLSMQPIDTVEEMVKNGLKHNLMKTLQSNPILNILYKSPHILEDINKVYLDSRAEHITLRKQYASLITWLSSYAAGTSKLDLCPVSSDELGQALRMLLNYQVLLPEIDLMPLLQKKIMDDIKSYMAAYPAETLVKNDILNVLYTSSILSYEQKLSIKKMLLMRLNGETELMEILTDNNWWHGEKLVRLGNIRDLLQNGANPYHKDHSGSTAFDLACGDEQILAVLATTTHKPVPVALPQFQRTSRRSPLDRISYTPHHLQTTSQAYLARFSPALAQYTDAHKIELVAEARVLPLHTLLPREILYTLPRNSSEKQGKYHVFYHAHTSSHRVYQDFMNHLLSFETQKTEDGFIPLRFWHDAILKTDILTFLEDHAILSKKKSDSSSHISSSLLAVNVSLFGNLQNSGESTLAYYLCNRSIEKVDLHKTLTAIFDFYNFKTGYIKRFTELLSASYMRHCGSMLQIFIPRAHVDRTAYLAQPYGYAYSHNLHVGGFETITTQDGKQYSLQTKISPVLDAIQDGKLMKKTSQELSDLQARIVLGKDVMLNPESGVKIFRIDNLPALKRAWYHQQIKKISYEIFIDWLERVRDNKVSNEVLERIKDTPLGKLVKNRDAATINELIKKLKDEMPQSTAQQPVSHL